MIHHPPPPHNHQRHPYDDVYEAGPLRGSAYQPHHLPSRSSHHPHHHRDAMNSPPSFYAIPPPPPAPAPVGMGSDPYHHQQQQQHLHQAPPPPPPPAAAMHSHHPPSGAYYPPSAPQPYMTHYPPPPPPAALSHPGHSPVMPNSVEGRDRAGSRYREVVDYPDHNAPFNPMDYQRHYTYGHGAAPATMPHPTPGYPAGYGKGTSPYANTNGYDGQGRPVNVKPSHPNLHSNIIEAHTSALSDQQPTYVGHIKTANDAILLLSACDLKWPPSSSSSSPSSSSSQKKSKTLAPPRRVTRRLLDAERADLVASGSVFVWDEKEAGMKRWTDGRVWSASRVSGCFLTYRELEARKKIVTSSGSINDGPSTNQYKPEGLIKQSFSITTTSGRKLHVISYFTKRDVREGRLRRVSEDPRFVGEGGGEWGLQVDDKEYSFPDMTQIGRTSDGQGDESNGLPSNSRRERGGDDESSELSDMSDRRSTSPRPVVAHLFEAPVDRSKPATEEAASRKRAIPEEGFANVYRTSNRPRLARLRSSSMSGLQSFRGEMNQSSMQSNTSLATTVPSESELNSAKNGQYVQPPPSYRQGLNARSSAVRALVSPTLPRESAIRDSACDMKPTQSQDCANAVGALLSLAGTSSSKAREGKETTSPSLSSPTSSSGQGHANGSSSNGLGLNVASGPERRASDRAALNKFSVRL